MRYGAFRAIRLTTVFLAALTAAGTVWGTGPTSAGSPQTAAKVYVPTLRAGADHEGVFVRRRVGDVSLCSEATLDEAQDFTRRDPSLQLHSISPTDEARAQTVGLKIQLRGTPQLDGFPAARQAFLRAAATWESLIDDEISIIIDVDFGPNRFGTPYPDGVIGATSAQTLGAAGIYPSVRNSMITGASSAPELALYNLLPVGTVPTDIGPTAAMSGTSAQLRALGQIPPIADPPAEPNFGNPPAIGFNSDFDFDFDPTDGISPNQIDFDGVAVHEIGHALGFISNVGIRELNPGDPSVAVWDVFRARPGITIGTFMTDQRILSSGGDQVFFAGGPSLALSTGRPDGTGGDGNQASHWKDDRITGILLGVMDPTIRDGQRLTITQNDLSAVDSMGYRLTGALPPDPQTTLLVSGVPQAGSIPAPPPGSGLLGAVQFTISVPDSATELRLNLMGDQDVDLLARFAQRITITGGVPDADHKSESDTGTESIVVTPTSNPPLRSGTYFIGVGNFGPGAANFTLTAIVISPDVENPPSVSGLAGLLDRNDLILTGTASDPDGDMRQAKVDLLDKNGSVVGTTNRLDVNFGSATSASFTITISGMENVPTALIARLEIFDSADNRSAATNVDFSLAEPGGAILNKVKFKNGNKLIVKGNLFAGALELEINGEIVGPPLRIKVKGSGSKLVIKGSRSELNLNNGPNRVRVISNGARSNIFVTNL